ncbi:hypothetical protein ASG73_15925 [Janibacter sp. Soil728]|uniref:urease accessory protein UreD n=1 Tax=Janibacter sp. Soil728 TaxID=1736393 RepID=UPI0006FB0190|nr:urease accessory protein UreD [Janibacter sp. Soil728]KRE36134.1 hypothetical protein ASG73_15925 [Janibacter sp. Soil728]
MTGPAPARVVVERVGGRTRITELVASQYLRPRLLGGDRELPRVALVANCASLLAGDDLHLDVRVGAGAHLELVEPSGTVAYNGRGGLARWSARVRVEEEARFVWGAAPFVIAQGAQVHRSTTLYLERGAVGLVRETLVLGRSGEQGGDLRSTLRADLEGRPLFVESLTLDDVRLSSSPAVLGSARVLDTVALLGLRPDELADPHETHLHGPGALRRELSEQAHLTEALVRPTWVRWRDLVTLGTPSLPA